MPKVDLEKVLLPTRVIVHRSVGGASELADALEGGKLTPAGGDTCELEAGGAVIARGRIVRKGRAWFFKVLETAGEERT